MIFSSGLLRKGGRRKSKSQELPFELLEEKTINVRISYKHNAAWWKLCKKPHSAPGLVIKHS
jgi:hypothetical protein